MYESWYLKVFTSIYPVCFDLQLSSEYLINEGTHDTACGLNSAPRMHTDLLYGEGYRSFSRLICSAIALFIFFTMSSCFIITFSVLFAIIRGCRLGHVTSLRCFWYKTTFWKWAQHTERQYFVTYRLLFTHSSNVFLNGQRE